VTRGNDGTVRVGRLFGIDVRFHYFFLLWIGLTFMWFGDPVFVAIFNAVLFGSVFLHELGHCLGARLVKGQALAIVLHPLGGHAQLRVPRTATAALISTGGGPLVNLLLCGGGIGLLLAGDVLQQAGDGGLSKQWFLGEAGESPLAFVGSLVLAVNAFLFVFNILPAFPLDGGGIFRALLWFAVGWRNATIATAVLAMAVGAGVAGLGLHWRQFILALIGAYVVYASWQELQRALKTSPAGWPTDDRMPYERQARDRDDDRMPWERRRPPGDDGGW